MHNTYYKYYFKYFNIINISITLTITLVVVDKQIFVSFLQCSYITI